MVASVDIPVNRTAPTGQMAGICAPFPRIDHSPAARRALGPLKAQLLQVTGRAA